MTIKLKSLLREEIKLKKQGSEFTNWVYTMKVPTGAYYITLEAAKGYTKELPYDTWGIYIKKHGGEYYDISKDVDDKKEQDIMMKELGNIINDFIKRYGPDGMVVDPVSKRFLWIFNNVFKKYVKAVPGDYNIKQFKGKTFIVKKKDLKKNPLTGKVYKD